MAIFHLLSKFLILFLFTTKLESPIDRVHVLIFLVRKYPTCFTCNSHLNKRTNYHNKYKISYAFISQTLSSYCLYRDRSKRLFLQLQLNHSADLASQYFKTDNCFSSQQYFKELLAGEFPCISTILFYLLVIILQYHNSNDVDHILHIQFSSYSSLLKKKNSIF